MQIFLMHPGDARAWPVMPQLVNRMCSFSQEEHGELEPDLIRDYMAHFITELVKPDQVMSRVWVKVEDDGLVTGHIMVEIGNAHGHLFGSVAQFSSDQGFPWPREEGALLWQHIQDWVAQMGGRQMRVRARTAIHARAYRMYYGLEPTTEVLMKKGV